MQLKDFIVMDVGYGDDTESALFRFDEGYLQKLHRRRIELWNIEETERAAREHREPVLKPVPPTPYGTVTEEEMDYDLTHSRRCVYDFSGTIMPASEYGKKPFRHGDFLILYEAATFLYRFIGIGGSGAKLGKLGMFTFDRKIPISDFDEALQYAGISSTYMNASSGHVRSGSDMTWKDEWDLDESTYHDDISWYFGGWISSDVLEHCCSYHSGMCRRALLDVATLMRQSRKSTAMMDSSALQTVTVDGLRVSKEYCAFLMKSGTVSYPDMEVSNGLRKQILWDERGPSPHTNYYIDGSEVTYDEYRTNRSMIHLLAKPLYDVARANEVTFAYPVSERYGKLWDNGTRTKATRFDGSESVEYEMDSLAVNVKDETPDVIRIADDLKNVKGIHVGPVSVGSSYMLCSRDAEMSWTATHTGRYTVYHGSTETVEYRDEETRIQERSIRQSGGSVDLGDVIMLEYATSHDVHYSFRTSPKTFEYRKYYDYQRETRNGEVSYSGKLYVTVDSFHGRGWPSVNKYRIADPSLEANPIVSVGSTAKMVVTWYVDVDCGQSMKTTYSLSPTEGPSYVSSERDVGNDEKSYFSTSVNVDVLGYANSSELCDESGIVDESKIVPFGAVTGNGYDRIVMSCSFYDFMSKAVKRFVDGGKDITRYFAYDEPSNEVIVDNVVYKRLYMHGFRIFDFPVTVNIPR